MTIKRILAMLLCVLMLGSLSPVGVFAEGDPCAEGHDYKAANVTSPTCTAMGYTTYVCSRCGDSYTEASTGALGHSYNVTSVPATCTTAGYRVYTCTRCGDSYTEPGEGPTGHSYSVSSVPATCTQAGYTVYTCSRCGDSYTEPGSGPLGHSYVPTAIPATCTQAGYTVYTCPACGDSYTEPGAPATGHNYVPTAVSPTCTEAGYTVYTCTRCGDSYTEPGAPATGHSYSAAQTVEPTCTEAGYTVYTCSACGDSYTEPGAPATGHSYSVAQTVEPTCTEAGYTVYTCSACGDSYHEPGEAALGHSYDDVEFIRPSCTEAGSVIYTCSRCSDVHTEAGEAALGHDYAAEVTEPTCTEAGFTTYTCTRCNDTYTEPGEAALGHDYVAEVTIPATLESEGLMTYTCSVCGDSYTETIEMLVPEFWKIKVAGCENGTVKVKGKDFESGDTVILLVTPDAGYRLAQLYVTDGLERTDAETAIRPAASEDKENEYSFRIPADEEPGILTVNAEFEAVPAVRGALRGPGDYTVTLDPGEGSGDPITYSSADQSEIPTSWKDAGNCQFYYEDDGSMAFKLVLDYCPDSFTPPSGYMFDEWEGNAQYNKLSSNSTTFTALWKVDPDLDAASYSLSPKAYTITNSGYTDITCSFDSLVLGSIKNEYGQTVQAEYILFYMNAGTLSDGAGHSIPFLVDRRHHFGGEERMLQGNWYSSQDETFIMAVYIAPADYDAAVPGTYTGVFQYDAVWNGVIPGESGSIALTLTIPEASDTYTVTVTVNDDTMGEASAAPESGEKGTEVTLSATPKEGYQFKEWKVVSGGVTVEDNKFTIGEANVEIQAVFEAIPAPTYTVTVSVNDDTMGEASATPASGAKGTEVTLTATPKEGYKFKEWIVTAGGVSVTENKFTIGEADVAIQAVFEKIIYTVTLDPGEASGDPITYTYNEFSPVLPDWEDAENLSFYTKDGEMGFRLDADYLPYTFAAPEGRKFLGWSDAGDYHTLSSENTTFTALWEDPYTTVTYKVANGTWSDGSTEDKTERVMRGASPASVPTGMIAAVDYVGGAWDKNPVGATITENTTFTYTFIEYDSNAGSYSLSPKAYTITKSGYTDITCSFDSLVFGNINTEIGVAQVQGIGFYMNAGTLSDGAGHSIPFLVDDYYHFGPVERESMGHGLSSADETFIMAVWIDPEDYDAAAPGTYTGAFSYDSEWTSGGIIAPGKSGSIALTLTIPDPSAAYTVTVTVNDEAMGTASADPASGAKGTEVTLIATPETGYRFKEWNVTAGGVTVSEDGKFNIGEADVVVQAVFEAIPATEYTVTVTVNDEAMGSASASPTSGAKDTEVTLTATPKEGYQFKEWQVTAGGVTVSEEGKFNIGEADVEVQAVFEATPVEPISISEAEVTVPEQFMYCHAAITPEISVTLGDETLQAGTDYTAEFSNNVNAGTATVTVTGTGNYKDTATGTFTINKAALTVKANDQEYAYDGNPHGEGDPVYNDPAVIAKKVTVSGLADGDALTSLVMTGQETEIGEYDGRIEVTACTVGDGENDNTDNYIITFEDGKLTITKPVFTVTFNPNGGKVSPASAETGTDGKLSSLPTPTYSGYKFLGWFNAQTGGSKITTSTVFSENKTVYAHWEKLTPGKVTTEVKPNGTGVTVSGLAEAADSILTAAEKKAVAEGQNAKVWVEIKSMSASSAPSGDASALKSYAVKNGGSIGSWYDVRLYKQVGSAAAVQVHQSAKKLTLTIPVPAALKKSGRSFTLLRCHNGSVAALGKGTGGSVSGATDSFSTYAMMLVDPAPVVPTYIVTFNNNGIGTPTAAQEVRSGSRAAWPPNPVAYGYVFGGWYWEPSCINAFDFNTPINGNITLFARWTRYNGRSAKTGDESNIGLWITLMAVSAVGVTAGVLLGTRKRRKKKNRK